MHFLSEAVEPRIGYSRGIDRRAIIGRAMLALEKQTFLVKYRYILLESMHKWEIEVRSGSYFSSLAHTFLSNDISFGFDDELGGYSYAFSPHIDCLEDVRSVSQRLFSLQLILNGALKVQWKVGMFYPTVFVSFGAAGRGPSYRVDASLIEDFPFSVDSEGVDTPAAGESYAAKLIRISRKDSAIRSLLFLWGLLGEETPTAKILAWGTLYRILDTIDHMAKKEKIRCSTLKYKQIGHHGRRKQYERTWLKCSSRD